MTLGRITTSVQHKTSDRWLVLTLVLVGIAVYLPRLAAVVLIDHDDVISVIGATCNQGRYEQSIPTAAWVAASNWQQYWQWQGFGCFGQISQDLVHYDIHPPLYFWLLHSWFGVFGVSVTAGLLLNLVILVVAVIVIYAVCRALSVSAPVSFVATLAWMLSLPTRTALAVVRQYTLFSMLTALLLLLVVLWLTKRQDRYVVAIGVVVAAGLLTHFHFVIPAAVMLLFAAAVLARRAAYTPVLRMAGTVLAAVVVSLLLHPGFLESLERADRQAQAFTIAGFAQRVGSVLATTFQIFDPLDWTYPLPYGLLDWHNPVFIVVNVLNVLVGFVATYLVVRFAIKAARSRPRSLPGMISIEYLPAFTAVATWCVVVALYVLCVSPVHAIGLQYLHFLTPLLFVAVAQLAHARHHEIPHAVSAAVVPVLLVGALIGTSVFVWHRSEQQQVLDIRQADALIVDTAAIGVLPAVLWHADPGTAVYAAPQHELATNFPDLSAAGDRLFYAASSAYDNTDEDRDRILARLEQAGYRNPTRVPARVVPLIPLGGDVWEFTRN